jgi:hypothetical protein
MNTTSLTPETLSSDFFREMVRKGTSLSDKQIVRFAHRAQRVEKLLREIHELTESAVYQDHELTAVMLTLGWNNPSTPRDYGALTPVLHEAFPEHRDIVAARVGVEQWHARSMAALTGKRKRNDERAA